MPRVSVVIPCYNYAGFLPDAVGSVLAQTYRDFEVIIVNDGSTDDTKDVALRLIGENPRVSMKLVDQENMGLPAARNAGIAKAEGEYILPLDADDMVLPEYLYETAGVLDAEPEASVAYTSYRMFGDVGGREKEAVHGREYDFERLLMENIIPVCCLYRKVAWEEAGGYKILPGYADWEFWITLGEAGRRFRYVRKPLFLYRKHGRSMIDNSEKRHEEIYTLIRKLHPALYDGQRLDVIIEAMGRSLKEKNGYIKYLEAENRRLTEFYDDMHSPGRLLGRLKAALSNRLGLKSGGPESEGGMR